MKKNIILESENQSLSTGHECYFFEGTADHYQKNPSKRKMIQKFFDVLSGRHKSFHIDGPDELPGVLFGTGVSGMMAIVNAMTDKYIEERQESTHKPTIHVMGHSRGAVIAMKFIEKINQYHRRSMPEAPKIFLYAHDPVTGPLNENWCTSLDDNVTAYFMVHSDKRALFSSTISPLSIAAKNMTFDFIPGIHTAGIASSHGVRVQRNDAAAHISYQSFYQHISQDLNDRQWLCPSIIEPGRAEAVLNINDPQDDDMAQRVLSTCNTNFQQCGLVSQEAVAAWVERSRRPFIKYLPWVWGSCPSHIRPSLQKVYPEFCSYFFESEGHTNRQLALKQKENIKTNYPFIYQILQYLSITDLDPDQRLDCLKDPRFHLAHGILHQYTHMAVRYAKKKDYVKAKLHGFKERFIRDMINGVEMKDALNTLCRSVGESVDLVNKQGGGPFLRNKGLYRSWFVHNMRLALSPGPNYLPSTVSQIMDGESQLSKKLHTGVLSLRNREVVLRGRSRIHMGVSIGYLWAQNGLWLSGHTAVQAAAAVRPHVVSWVNAGFVMVNFSSVATGDVNPVTRYEKAKYLAPRVFRAVTTWLRQSSGLVYILGPSSYDKVRNPRDEDRYPRIEVLDDAEEATQEDDQVDVSQEQQQSRLPALMLAARSGHLDTVRELLGQGANVDETNKGGQTALMLAARSGHLDVVRTLLDSGANPNLENNKGETAQMLAEAQSHHGVVEKLLEREAGIRSGGRRP